MNIKLCECGCEQPAPIAKQNSKKKGWVKGQPKRFISGHNVRGKFREKSHHWNGGRYVDCNGYVCIKKSDYPRADSQGYVLEHIVIAEKALGKPLPASACLHHVNGNRSDNRKGNLVVCQGQEYHMLLHRRKRALEACGHANWRKCPFCKEHDDPQKLYINSKYARHRECKNKYDRKRRKEKE